MRKTSVIAAIGLSLGLLTAATAAQVNVFVDRTTAPPCNRDASFARTINVPPADAGYYFALDCETVFADGVTVVLPPLTGTTKLKRIVVRNVGDRAVIVAARQPDDTIDAAVSAYTDTFPQQPVLSGGVSALVLHAGESIALTANQPSLPNVWFTLR